MATLARSFRELNVYGRARNAARAVFQVTKGFPREERYSLTDQLRRSSRAVNALVAEAWARRRYPAAFANKVDEALGEASETQAWLDHAMDCGYISATDYRAMDAEWQGIGGMLNNMIDRAEEFCRHAAAKRTAA